MSARLCADILERAGHEVSTADVSALFASSDGIGYPVSDRTTFHPGGLSIYHLNPSMLLPGIIRSGLSRYYRSYNIGYWAWELECLPDEWIEAIRFMNAILVPSRFCQAVVQHYTSKPVLVVPHPVQEVMVPAAPAAGDAGRFRVLSIFRFGSSFERKNPIALVRAFRAAFGDEDAVRLVLKTSYGDRYPSDKAQLMREVGDGRNIDVIDEVWEEKRISALIQSADVYASLHRSEGFGLPIAEAIMLERPVIATNWSGNTDFCSAEHTFPVDYRLIRFDDGHPDYEGVPEARWADPSIEHAAKQLRRIRKDPDAARRKAEAAKRDLIRHLQSFSYERALQTLIAGETVAPTGRVMGPEYGSLRRSAAD